jgi:poly(3-hydroxyalkanoate) synthetase
LTSWSRPVAARAWIGAVQPVPDLQVATPPVQGVDDAQVVAEVQVVGVCVGGADFEGALVLGVELDVIAVRGC